MTDQYQPEGPLTDDTRPIPDWADESLRPPKPVREEYQLVQKFRPSEMPRGMTAWEAFEHSDHLHRRYDELAEWLKQEPGTWAFLEVSEYRKPGGSTSPFTRRGIQLRSLKRREAAGFNVFVRYAPEDLAMRSRYAPGSRLAEIEPDWILPN